MSTSYNYHYAVQYDYRLLHPTLLVCMERMEFLLNLQYYGVNGIDLSNEQQTIALDATKYNHRSALNMPMTQLPVG